MSELFFGQPKIRPLPSQQAAFDRLMELAELFFSDAWHPLSIQPRIHPMVIGPSGVGKTWLVRHLAFHVGNGYPYPILSLNFGDWIPTGARIKGGHTLSVLHDFVLRHPFGILHLDEMDKFAVRTTDWNCCVQQELFAVLDHRPHIAHDRVWNDDLRNKLRKKFLIIGSGTWQSLWDQRPVAGFAAQPTQGTDAMAERLKKQNSIPEELLRRFNAQPIFLAYMQRGDAEAVIKALEDFEDPELLEGIHARVDEIVESRKGVRWFEEFFTERLMELRRGKHKNDEFNF